MGIRRTWLKLMKPSARSWDDVHRAIAQCRAFVRNLRDEVFYTRRGPYTRPSSTEGQRVKKLLDTLDDVLNDAKGRAKFWEDVYEGRALPGFTREEAEQSLKAWTTEFEDAISASVQGSITKILDKVLKLLREDAARLVQHDERHPDNPFEPDAAFKVFDLHAMKVVVDDDTVPAGMINEYIRYLDEAYKRLRQKGFGKAWYGEVFIQCEKCGGPNPYDPELGVGGHYKIGPDTVGIFSRPSDFIVKLMVHELGHRYWFKNLRPAQRAKFKNLVKVKGTEKAPTENDLTIEDVDDIARTADQSIKSLNLALRDFQKVFSSSTKTDQFGNYSEIIASYKSLSNSLAEITGFGGISRMVRDRFFGPSRVRHKTDPEHELRRKLLEELIKRHFRSTYDLTNLELVGKWAEFIKKQNEDEVLRNLAILSKKVDKIETDMAAFVRELYRFAQEAPQIPSVSDYGAKDITEAWAEVFTHYVLDMNMTRDQVDSFKSVLKTASNTELVRRAVERLHRKKTPRTQWVRRRSALMGSLPVA